MVIAAGVKLDEKRSELLGRALITRENDLISNHQKLLEEEIQVSI